MQSLRRELSSGMHPLRGNFVALVHVFAKNDLATRCMEILATMERYKHNIRKVWLVLVDSCLYFFCEEKIANLHVLIQDNCLYSG